MLIQVTYQLESILSIKQPSCWSPAFIDCMSLPYKVVRDFIFLVFKKLLLFGQYWNLFQGTSATSSSNMTKNAWFSSSLILLLHNKLLSSVRFEEQFEKVI